MREGKQNDSEIRNAGIFQEKAELEKKISRNLKLLSKELTKHEIQSLMEKIHTEKDLDTLKSELDNHSKFEGKELSDDSRLALSELIESSRRMTEIQLEALKLEIGLGSGQKYPEYVIHPDQYPSHRFEIVRKMEKSRLGEKIWLDIAGASIGAIDSAVILFKTLLTILWDLVVLPKDLYDIWKS